MPNQTSLIAFSVGGGNYFQTDNRGAHCLTKHLLGSGMGEGDKKEEREREEWVMVQRRGTEMSRREEKAKIKFCSTSG